MVAIEDITSGSIVVSSVAVGIKAFDKENEQLREQLQQKDQLEARLRKNENPHTPPNKCRTATGTMRKTTMDELTVERPSIEM